MQANQLRRLAPVEMAAHGLARALVKLCQIVCFGKNGFPHRAGGEAAFGSFLDHENDLAHVRDDSGSPDVDPYFAASMWQEMRRAFLPGARMDNRALSAAGRWPAESHATTVRWPRAAALAFHALFRL